MSEEAQTAVDQAASGDQKVSVITCEPVVDISVVDELFLHLKKALLEKHEVEIDAGEVTRVDGAVLQLLSLFFRDASNAGMAIRWKRVSGSLHDAAKLVGLLDVLKLPKTVEA